MTNRALVIGSQTGGLTGVESDARRMAEYLRKRGFQPRLITGADATRKGILDAYDQLIGTVYETDAAVVYYSGHGNFAINVLAPADSLQDIVPVDYADSTEQDYRGISSDELSIKLQQLTERTQNATVILDCCHAAQMSRDGAARDAVARALPHPLWVDLDAYRSELERLYPSRMAKLGATGNIDPIRLVACARSEMAMEYTNSRGERTGAFTEALLELLDEIGDTRVSWEVLAQAVRERVLRRFPSQRPDLAGRGNRLVFSLDEQAPNGVVPIKPSDTGYQIGAGRIHAVNVGDKYNVAALKAQDRRVAQARVTAIEATTASVELTWSGAASQLPDRPVAIPVERAARRRAITVVATEQRAAIAAAITETGTLRVADDGDPDPSIATLRLSSGQLTVEDAAGPLFPDGSYPDALAAAVQNLKNLGVACALRELEGAHRGDAHGVYADELEIEWGVVEIDATKQQASGKPVVGRRPLPDHGAALGLGDRIYCRIANRALRMLHVHVFNIGLQGTVTLLTSWAPSGVALNGGDDVTLGKDPDRTLHGLRLMWPTDLPRSTFPRLDTLLVIATVRPANLAALQTTAAVMRSVEPKGSGLQRLLAQVQLGGTRNISVGDEVDGYFAKQLTFQLHPRDGRMVSAGFLIDDAPGTRGISRAAAAWRKPAPSKPQTISIRLKQLTIDDTHAWFPTDVRVDALVCTRPGEATPGYAPATMRFPRMHKAKRAPLDNAQLYHGPVADFVDICLWVTRDEPESDELTKLIAVRANDAGVKDALGVLLTTAGVAATEPWVAAVGAGAVLARVAYEAIRTVSGDSIGLYRTSFLASENYGIGRYPRQGTYRAQGFSFSLLIERVR